eukprot:m.258540 g.258540  ORF g.258540 m.258540 type:complete len:1892 (-) comp22721_c0_seq5:19-5694(-)
MSAPAGSVCVAAAPAASDVDCSSACTLKELSPSHCSRTATASVLMLRIVTACTLSLDATGTQPKSTMSVEMASRGDVPVATTLLLASCWPSAHTSSSKLYANTCCGRNTSSNAVELLASAPPQGVLYHVDLEANSSTALELVFRPQQVFAYNFELLVCADGQQLASRSVVATGTSPLLAISTDMVDFGCVPVASSDNVQAVTIRNISTEAVAVRLQWEGDSSFSVQADEQSTSLAAGAAATHTLPAGADMVVAVRFQPRQAGYSQGTVSVWANGVAAACARVAIQAAASTPRLSFSEPFVHLPIVPLGVEASAVFFVQASGYHTFPVHISCTLPTDRSRAPLEVSFPEGTAFESEEDRALPVVLAFAADEPCSFDVSLVFLDPNGNKFPIQATGRTDNSLMSLYLFVAKNRDAYFVSHEANLDEGQYLARVTSAVCRWLSLSGLAQPQPISIPESLQNGFGRTAFDIIQHLSGKRIPGLPLVRPSTVKQGQLREMYSHMLRFLIGQGAVLSGVLPELLLPRSDFQHWLLQYDKQIRDAGLSHEASEIARRELHRQIETALPQLASRAWTAVMLQVFSLFSLSRVTVRAVQAALDEHGAMLGMELDAAEELEQLRDDVSAASAIHGTQEQLLLAWMTYHHRYVTGVTVAVENFGDDLADGVVLASVLASHVPTLAPTHFASMFPSPTDSSQRLHNALRVIAAMQDIGLEMPLVPEDICTPCPIFMVMVATTLFTQLPQYLTAQTLIFRGELSESVVRSIQLDNPSDKALNYRVRLDASLEFKCPPSLTVPARSGASLPVEYTPHFAASSTATLYLIGRPGGPARNTVLVFSLVSEAAAGPPRREAAHGETPCYEVTTIPVRVANPYPREGAFAVSLTCPTPGKSDTPPGLSSSKNGTNALGGRRKPAGTSSKVVRPRGAVSNAAMEDTGRTAFWCNESVVRIAAGQTVVVPVQFLPTRLGAHAATLVLADPALGEIFCKVSGQARLPSPQQTLQWACDITTTPLHRSVRIPCANPLRLHALSRVPGEAPRLENPLDMTLTTRTGPLTADASGTLQVRSTGHTCFQLPDSITLHPTVSATPSSRKTVNVPSAEPTVELPVVFAPVDAGTYVCDVVLSGYDDVRVIRIEATAVRDTSFELVFSSPAQQETVQELPVHNDSDTAWHIRAVLTPGSGAGAAEVAFSGPPELEVPAHTRGSYALRFAPQWPGEQHCQLTLHNDSTGNRTVYDLVGTATSPEPDTHLELECQAQHTTVHMFTVTNRADTAVVFQLLCDLPCASGPATVAVPAHSTVPCDIAFTPRQSGQMQGSVCFVTPDHSQMLTVALTLRVALSAPKQTLDLTCPIWESVEIEVPVANPLQQEVDFSITLVGDHADEIDTAQSLHLGPSAQGKFVLQYTPDDLGDSEVQIVLTCSAVGQFWYLLRLHCKNPDPVTLPALSAPFGHSVSYNLKLDNPTDSVLVLAGDTSTPEFSLVPNKVVLEANSSAVVNVVFSPSQVGQFRGEVVFRSTQAGTWVYHASGQGTAAAPLPSVPVRAVAGQKTQAVVNFRNPRLQRVRYRVQLDLGASEPGIVALTLPTATLTVEAQSDTSIPLVYAPPQVCKHSVRLLLLEENQENSVTFEIPVDAEGEMHLSVPSPIHVSCAARSSITHTLQLALEGWLDEGDTAAPEVVALLTAAAAPVLKDDLVLTCTGQRVEQGVCHCTVECRFSPMRRFDHAISLAVSRRAGGRWIVPARFSATRGPLDDTIQIEVAALRKTSRVGFRLKSGEDHPVNFRTQWEGVHLEELSVHPSVGQLSPSEEGTLFVVSYTARNYGKPPEGLLVIQTDDMEWIYKISAVFPNYSRPQATKAIDNKLSQQTQLMRSTKATVRDGRNVIKSNSENSGYARRYNAKTGQAL